MISYKINQKQYNLTYDQRNRLIQINDIVYKYDSENTKIQRQEKDKITNYITDPNANLSKLLIKHDNQGNITKYIYGNGLIGQEENGIYSNYHYDNQGNTTHLTDNIGQMKASYTYDPYGNITSKQGSIDTIFKYSGKYGVQEEPNNLLYMRSRYYQVEIGRFTASDSYEGNKLNILSQNRYTYVEGNPINYIDPLGLEKIVMSGGLKGHEDFKYMFIETALKDILRLKEEMQKTGENEQITWIVADHGYEIYHKNKIQEIASLYSVKLKFIKNKDEFINYINTKNTSNNVAYQYDVNNHIYMPPSQERIEDKITYFSNFSHGVSGALAWGYNGDRVPTTNKGQELYFWSSDIKKLNKQAFSEKIYSISYACNTGTVFKAKNHKKHKGEVESVKKLIEGKSFAQEWATHTSGKMKAVYGGVTDYRYINDIKEGVNYTKEELDNKMWGGLARKSGGFSYTGSLNYPTNYVDEETGEGSEWKTFE